MKVSRGFRPRVAGASRAKDDLDVDPVRHLNAHELTKGPIWGDCLKASITRGFVGRILTRAASPVFRKSGFSGFGAPVFGSRAAMISSKVHATWAVWAWKTGVYPAVMTLG